MLYVKYFVLGDYVMRRAVYLSSPVFSKVNVFFKEKICITFKAFSLSYVWCKSVKNTVSHKSEIQFLFILFYYLLFMGIGVCLQCMCEGVGCN